MVGTPCSDKVAAGFALRAFCRHHHCRKCRWRTARLLPSLHRFGQACTAGIHPVETCTPGVEHSQRFQPPDGRLAMRRPCVGLASGWFSGSRLRQCTGPGFGSRGPCIPQRESDSGQAGIPAVQHSQVGLAHWLVKASVRYPKGKTRLGAPSIMQGRTQCGRVALNGLKRVRPRFEHLCTRGSDLRVEVVQAKGVSVQAEFLEPLAGDGDCADFESSKAQPTQCCLGTVRMVSTKGPPT